MNPYFPTLLPQLLMDATARRAALSTETRQREFNDDEAGAVPPRPCGEARAALRLHALRDEEIGFVLGLGLV